MDEKQLREMERELDATGDVRGLDETRARALIAEVRRLRALVPKQVSLAEFAKFVQDNR